MTNRELIEILQQFPSDCKVKLCTYDECYLAVNDIKQVALWEKDNKQKEDWVVIGEITCDDQPCVNEATK